MISEDLTIEREQDDGFSTVVQQLTANQPAIRAFIVSLMPGSPDTGDILQETNLVIWRKRARFKPGTNFLAWALTIARFEVLRHRERLRRDGAVPFSDDFLEAVCAETRPSRDHETYLHALDHCLEKLDARQREMIEHRYLPGKSIEDLAAREGRPAGTLRVALLRLRTALKSCVERQLAEAP